jgi:hypothetical protein
MELMQKYTKDDGAVGIDNLERWRTCPAAIEFLSATTSASSFEELKRVREPLHTLIPFRKSLTGSQHRLLMETRWCPGDLIGLAWFALISARTFYSYVPRPKENKKAHRACERE